MSDEAKSKIGEMTARDALIVVDVQKDFCPSGALAVAEGDKVVAVINRLQDLFTTVIFSRDWHPPDHVSFSAEPKFVDGSWPRHCVAGSDGAAFHRQLQVPLHAPVISKGNKKDHEAYSAFEACDLAGDLRQQQMERLFVVGLATNYCVKETVLAGLKEGFAVVVVADACRGIDVPAGAVEQALEEMARAGAIIVNSKDLPTAV